jgi:hypothetical protein
VHEGDYGVYLRGSGTMVDASEAWRVLVCTRGAGTDRRAQVTVVTGGRAHAGQRQRQLCLGSVRNA